MNTVKPAVVYFLLVFGAGFVLGIIRVLVILPLVGERAAELIEMPFLLTVIVIAACWLNRHLLPDAQAQHRIAVGLLAMGLVLAADLVVGITLRGLSLSEVFFDRDPVSGTAYYPAHIIHERFYCNRRYAAATSLAAAFSRPGGQARPS